MWKQTKSPNLDPYIKQGNIILTDWLGWCLAYVQSAFGTGWAGSTAWSGWTDITKLKHGDRNYPLNVYFPLWFDGYWNGQRLGHVVIGYWNGSSLKIWSSPVTHKPYADTWTSIEAVERAYGMKYVGWSEDLGGTRVIEWVAVTSRAQIEQAYKEVLERLADEGGIQTYLKSGWNIDRIKQALRESPEYNALQARKEAERLAAAARAAAQAKADEDKKRNEEAARIAAEQQAIADKAEADRLAAELASLEASKKAGYTEADRTRDNETNNIIKLIWQFLTNIFKGAN